MPDILQELETCDCDLCKRAAAEIVRLRAELEADRHHRHVIPTEGPGRWEIFGPYDTNGREPYYEILNKNHEIVAMVYGSTPEQAESRARLIAAARDNLVVARMNSRS